MSLKIFDTQLGVQGMEGIGKSWALLGPSLDAAWSISCIGLHSFQQDNIVP
jgi:hypothetical protein